MSRCVKLRLLPVAGDRSRGNRRTAVHGYRRATTNPRASHCDDGSPTTDPTVGDNPPSVGIARYVNAPAAFRPTAGGDRDPH